ncbi:poly(A) RNA polymerase gld-2 homolog A [Anoplolepis gracilipes]|uniref:poly(A) RNA polymerase gld-2 homolog A n=1 Tax=Anoplolepis gracilipes TaxID=354296 RepID=UPI003BA26C0F
MYHTVFPPQMMVQMMSGQQIGGQCPSAQTHTLHINNINGLHQTDFTYGLDITRHNRSHTIQTGSHPLEFLHQMGVDVRQNIEYIQSNNNSSPVNWERQMCTSNNTSIIPASNYNFKPTNTNSMKKPSWNNRNGRRNTYRNSYSKYETYNSDSGFSSRSPTPNKYHIDNSLTESSDERDSTSSLRGQGIRKHQRIHSDNRAINKPTSNGLISSASAHQFYQNQRPVNYYNTVSTPRSHAQNYQNRRKYVSGRSESAPSQRNFLRNRKFSEVLVPNYGVVSKYFFTAPDKFLAKSHLAEVTSAPKNIMTGSKWDSLSQQIWLKFISNQQTEATYRNKMKLWKNLYVYIKDQYPKYGLFLVGSTMNGFGSDNSDVDMCLLVRHTEMDQKYEAIEHLEQILKYLKKCNFIEQLELIHAKVPIIKFRDTVQNLKVDLNCNNAVGIRNTQLLYYYSKLDWRVKPLVLVIKLWAQYHDINNAKNMTISSYSLVLMVIHFLQCGVNPPVLPCLHSIFVGKFSPHTDIHTINMHEDLKIPSSTRLPENHQSLGELLVEFFRYYVKFDFSRYAISVRLAKKIPIEECRMVQSLKNDPHQWKYLCIEEPFDLTNTARSVYDPDVFFRITQLIDRTYQRLQKKQDLNLIFLNLITDHPIVNYFESGLF